MDNATLCIATKFVEWWKSGVHGWSRAFHGAEYSLAREAFLVGLTASLVNSLGEELPQSRINSLRAQIEEAIKEVQNGDQTLPTV